MWLPTNTHREMNSSHLRVQRVKQMPRKDHRDHPIFLEYSSITGTFLSSWNIQGSLAPSYLLGIFKDHWHHPIFLEYSRIIGTVLSSYNTKTKLQKEFERGVREAIYIQTLNTSLNRYGVRYNLTPIWNNIIKERLTEISESVPVHLWHHLGGLTLDWEGHRSDMSFHLHYLETKVPQNYVSETINLCLTLYNLLINSEQLWSAKRYPTGLLFEAQ